MQKAFGLDIVASLEDALEPKHLALLVYDMQVGIAGRVPGGQTLISNVQKVLGAAREAGVRVFFCRHMTLPNEVAGAAQLRGAMALQRVASPAEVKPNFLRDSPGFALVPELEPLPSEAVFDKLMMSAFTGSLLDFAWRDAGIGAFAIVGAVLELGIEPTVRHGADLGYYPVVVEDACYSFSPDARASSLTAARRLGAVTDSAAFARLLDQGVKTHE